MSAFSALVILGMVRCLSPRRWRRAALALAGTAVLVGPLVATAGALVWILDSARRERERQEAARRAAVGEVTDLARFLLIGTGAGWSLAESIRQARPRLESALGGEVDEIVRRGRVDGLASALAGGTGAGQGLYRLLARSHLGGAPLDRTLAAFIRDSVERRRGEITERARRLPVRLVVPLTLLMLPGFVLLVAGPTVVITARRLLAPFVT